jgi:hypothetical protein
MNREIKTALTEQSRANGLPQHNLVYKETFADALLTDIVS